MTPSYATVASQYIPSLFEAGVFDAVPEIDIDELITGRTRAVVVAPQPQDEVLGTGGLLAVLFERGVELAVVAVTDGTASHDGSPYWTREKLARARPRETGLALARLGLAMTPIQRLGLPHGAISHHVAELRKALEQSLRPGDMVFAPWSSDGQPDHEAVAAACGFAAKRCGARLVEVPICAWQWAKADDPRVPWKRAHRIHLPAHIAVRKKGAVRAFRSQVEPDRHTGKAPIMSSAAIDVFSRDYEVLFL